MKQLARFFPVVFLALTLVACGEESPDSDGSDEENMEDDDDSADDDDSPDDDFDGTTSTSGACARSADIPADGSASIEYVNGEDDLNFDAGESTIDLRTGNVSTAGRDVQVQLRGRFGEIDSDGHAVCVSLTNLIFKYFRGTPEVGADVSYAYDGDATDQTLTEEYPARFFVDVNEDMSAAGTLEVDFLGTEGSFSFTALNEIDSDDPDNFYHSVAFDVVFSPVVDGAVDDSVATRLAGDFTFQTFNEL